MRCGVAGWTIKPSASPALTGLSTPFCIAYILALGRLVRTPADPCSRVWVASHFGELHELFRDAAVVHDQGRRDAALLPVVVVDLDDVHPATVGQRCGLAVRNRVPVVDDDPYLSACHVNETKPGHNGDLDARV